MSNFRQEGHAPIKFTAPTGGVTVDVPVIIGGWVVIPQDTVAVGETFSGCITGVWVLPKASGFAPSAGDIAYFDFGSDSRLESAATPIGKYTRAAASGDLFAEVLLTPEAFGPLEFQFALKPEHNVATSVDFDWTAPAAGEFDEIQMHTGARPSSSAGTVVETVTNLTGTLNVLSGTNVNLEADITNDTKLAPALSGTAANKRFAAGDVIRFRQTANNADVVAGAGISHRVRWHRIDA